METSQFPLQKNTKKQKKNIEMYKLVYKRKQFTTIVDLLELFQRQKT